MVFLFIWSVKRWYQYGLCFVLVITWLHFCSNATKHNHGKLWGKPASQQLMYPRPCGRTLAVVVFILCLLMKLHNVMSQVVLMVLPKTRVRAWVRQTPKPPKMCVQACVYDGLLNYIVYERVIAKKGYWEHFTSVLIFFMVANPKYKEWHGWCIAKYNVSVLLKF